MTKITVDKALIEQALEAIELNWKSDEGDAVKPLLRAALDEPAVERVATLFGSLPVYDTPPAEVPLLSDREIKQIARESGLEKNEMSGEVLYALKCVAQEQAARRNAGLK